MSPTFLSATTVTQLAPLFVEKHHQRLIMKLMPGPTSTQNLYNYCKGVASGLVTEDDTWELGLTEMTGKKPE